MRRTQEDERVQSPDPATPGALRVVAGASRHESAHAVADHDESIDRMRPFAQQRFHELVELAPIHRQVPPGVVVEVQRRVAEIASERCAVVVPVARPLQVVHAQAVHEDDHFVSGLGKRGGQRIARDADGASGDSHGHCDRERVARRGQMVAEHAVQCRHGRLALVRGTRRAPDRRQHAEQCVRADANEPASRRAPICTRSP